MQSNDRIQDDASIASRYLAGTLTESEQEAYEQYFIVNPHAVQELEATARMKVGLANLRETGQLAALLRAPAAPGSRPLLLGLAASLAIAVIGVLLWRSPHEIVAPALMAASSDLLDEFGKPLAPGPSYALQRLRASDYDALVELPGQPRAIELRVRPEAAAPLYRGTLSRIHPDGSVIQVAAVEDLRPEADGFARLYLDSSKLAPGPYLLVLSGEGDAEAVATSSFRLRMREARSTTPN